ncbi:MAG: hypothetical protein JNK05_35355 [Myxococcales bacterium]|nr:hypothetical protein [Myxococcales bacterium]
MIERPSPARCCAKLTQLRGVSRRALGRRLWAWLDDPGATFARRKPAIAAPTNTEGFMRATDNTVGA